MHSDITNDTGSTATETGRLLYCIREECVGTRRERGVPGTESRVVSMVGSRLSVSEQCHKSQFSSNPSNVARMEKTCPF